MRPYRSCSLRRHLGDEPPQCCFLQYGNRRPSARCGAGSEDSAYVPTASERVAIHRLQLQKQIAGHLRPGQSAKSSMMKARRRRLYPWRRRYCGRPAQVDWFSLLQTSLIIARQSGSEVARVGCHQNNESAIWIARESSLPRGISDRLRKVFRSRSKALIEPTLYLDGRPLQRLRIIMF